MAQGSDDTEDFTLESGIGRLQDNSPQRRATAGEHVEDTLDLVRDIVVDMPLVAAGTVAVLGLVLGGWLARRR